MNEQGHPTAEEASQDAVHKAKNAAAAVEVARSVQIMEAAQVAADHAATATSAKTREMILSTLKEVFGEGDEVDSRQMKVLVRRIPILCQDIRAMHDDIASSRNNLEIMQGELLRNTKATDKINETLSRLNWIVLTAVIGALLGLIFIN